MVPPQYICQIAIGMLLDVFVSLEIAQLLETHFKPVSVGELQLPVAIMS